MQRNPDGERLLILTLGLEAAISESDWKQVTELFRARQALIEELSGVSSDWLMKIATVEERMLILLQTRLQAVRADMRNLSAVLKIAGPYAKVQRQSMLSLAS